jgi:hypothetical protein
MDSFEVCGERGKPSFSAPLAGLVEQAEIRELLLEFGGE